MKCIQKYFHRMVAKTNGAFILHPIDSSSQNERFIGFTIDYYEIV